MIHVSNVGVLEIAIDRDRSISVERKVQFGEEDIFGVREAPLLPELLIFRCPSPIQHFIWK